MFPRIYEDAKCPLDGYEALSFRVLVNPTGAEKNDWALGHMGIDGCPDCAKLGTPRGKQSGIPEKKYCISCTEARTRMGRSAVAIYGPSRVPLFDFATPDAALATFGQADLPDELLLWLYMLPQALWAARAGDIKKKLATSLRAGDS